MTRTRRPRRRWAVPLAVATGLAGAVPVGQLGPVSEAAAAPAAAPCPAESYPPQGSRRSDPFRPYLIPIVAHIEGGTIVTQDTSPPVSTTIGPIFGTACGTTTLPSLNGTIPPQNINLEGPGGNPQIPVSVVIGGLKIAAVYAESSGTIAATLSRQPAANGGIDATEDVTFKVTLSLSNSIPIALPGVPQVTIPVGSPMECTLVAGDIAVPSLGASAADISQSETYDRTKPYMNLFTPVHLTTETSAGPLPSEVAVGQPVTGPPTAGEAVVVNQNSSVGPFFPDIPVANTTTPAPLGCPQPVADLLNNGFGLPFRQGQARTTIPTTFAVNVS